ncbi:hypothetical protein [Nocardia salmonicida]|nr:hypothetical protein [Nocardia salmonicida]
MSARQVKGGGLRRPVVRSCDFVGIRIQRYVAASLRGPLSR